MTPGLPPAGAAGQFIGFDPAGKLHLLKHYARGDWWAFDVNGIGRRAGFIVRHVSVAAIEAAFAPPAHDNTAEAP